LFWLPFQINQKMMKSAMIKDLYSEIDRLKQGAPLLHCVFKLSWKHKHSYAVELGIAVVLCILQFLININFFIQLDLTTCLMCWFPIKKKTNCQRYMLPEKKMESIYHEIVIFKTRLKRRFTSYHISADIFFTWLYIEVWILIISCVQEMAEKIERMELDSESKDKVCFIKIFAWFFASFHAQKSV
jgi:hypothetical protein